MIYGRLPYDPMESLKMYNQIINKNIFPSGGNIHGVLPSQPVLDLLKKLLVVDQHKRISWGELIKLPIFQSKASLPDQFRVVVNLDDLKKKETKIRDRNEEE
jgi:serine/threonine protein kinase